MFGIGSILSAVTDPLESLESTLANDFQSILQQIGGQGQNGNGGTGSSILSAAEDVLPLVAAFL
jgi:hypothetical protein